MNPWVPMHTVEISGLDMMMNIWFVLKLNISRIMVLEESWFGPSIWQILITTVEMEGMERHIVIKVGNPCCIALQLPKSVGHTNFIFIVSNVSVLKYYTLATIYSLEHK